MLKNIIPSAGVRVTIGTLALRTENADINLWYSQDGEYLALKTGVKGGRTLAYFRTENATESAALEGASDVQDI